MSASQPSRPSSSAGKLEQQVHPSGRLQGPSSLEEVWAYRGLLRNLTLRELRSKYRRTTLGQGWSLLNPLAFLAIYALVFSFVLRVQSPIGNPSGLDSFVLWLASGLLPFLYLNAVIITSIGTLVGNANLIRKVYFPRETLVLANVSACLITFTLELVILHVAIGLADGVIRVQYLLATVYLIGLLTMFATGIALVASVLNVYFRDTSHLATIVLQAWLYASPVIYPVTLVSGRLGEDSTAYTLYSLNPMTRFVEAFRHTIFDARLPDVETVGYLTVVSVVMLCLGHLVFRALEGKVAEEL